jgi:hypothetical protein
MILVIVSLSGREYMNCRDKNRFLHVSRVILITIIVQTLFSINLHATTPLFSIPDIPEDSSLIPGSVRLVKETTTDCLVVLTAADKRGLRLVGRGVSGYFDTITWMDAAAVAIGEKGRGAWIIDHNGSTAGPYSEIVKVHGSAASATWAVVIRNGRRFHVISRLLKSRPYNSIGDVICHDKYGVIFTGSRRDGWYMQINNEWYGPYEKEPALYSDISGSRSLAYAVYSKGYWYLVTDYGIMHGPYSSISAAAWSPDGKTIAARVTGQSGETLLVINGDEQVFPHDTDGIALSSDASSLAWYSGLTDGFTIYSHEKRLDGPFAGIEYLFYDEDSQAFVYAVRWGNAVYLSGESLAGSGPWDFLSKPRFTGDMSQWFVIAENSGGKSLLTVGDTVIFDNWNNGWPVISDDGSWAGIAYESGNEIKTEVVELK